MSLIKYRLRDVATDFGKTPKEITEVISKFFEKPKSNNQVLTEEELNVVFDYITQTNQIKSLEQVFAVKPKEQPNVSSIVCSVCGKPIPAETLINGKRYSAEDIAATSRKKYGADMCYACKRKADSAEKTA